VWRDPRTIATTALLVACTSAASGAVKPGTYCSREELKTSAGDDLGEWAADAEIKRTGSAWTLSFSNGMPDSGQIVETGIVKLRKSPNGEFHFRFTDNWGAKGVGTLKQTRTGINVDIKRLTDASDDWGNNAGRNYGPADLIPAPCKRAH